MKFFLQSPEEMTPEDRENYENECSFASQEAASLQKLAHVKLSKITESERNRIKDIAQREDYKKQIKFYLNAIDTDDLESVRNYLKEKFGDLNKACHLNAEMEFYNTLIDTPVKFE
jgi:hypothetical protein